LAGLVFAVIQLSDPPSSLPSSGMPGVSSGAVAGSAAGTGETVAIIGIVIAEIAMQVMLAAAHADRRRRGQRRRQRAIGSAARASRGALPAGEAPDAPA
jgi:type IV secretory pathway TrbL component